MLRTLLVIFGTAVVASILHGANMEPSPAQAGKPLIASVPCWKANEDDPLPKGALLRLGNSRARHGIASNIAASKDGKTLYACLADRSVCIWETESGKLIRRIKALSNNTRWIAVSPDGNILAVASSSSIHLWNLTDPSDTPRTLQGHQNDIAAIDFSSDGGLLISGGHDRKARLWDVEGGKSIREINADADNSINSVIFTRDDRSFFTCSYTGRVIQWKTENGEKLREWKGPKEIAQLFTLPDGKTLGAITYREGTYLWDLTRKDSDWHVKHLPGREGYGAFSPDGKLLITAEHSFPADAPVKIYDLANQKDLLELPGHRGGTYLFVFSPDSKTLTTYGNDHTLRRWDLATKKEIGAFGGHQNRVTGACFSRDARQVITCSQDGTIRLWDAGSGKETYRLTAEDEHFDSMALSPDGKTLAIAGSPLLSRWRWELSTEQRNFNLRIWNLETKKEENRWHVPGHPAHELHFTPDGREVLSVGWGKVVFHDLKTGKTRQPIPNAQQSLRAAAISPDGKTVAISTDEPALRQIGKAAYYDSATGKEIFSRTFAFGSFNTLAFSPNGQWLAISEGGRRSTDTLSIWQVPTDKIVRRLSSPRFDHYQLAYSPDGRLVAAADPEGISVFEVATGQQRLRFAGGHIEEIRAVAFSSDTRKFVTGADDTVVIVWDLTGNAGTKVAPLEPRALDQAWANLAELDGELGGRTIARLAARPAESVPYLRNRLGVLSAEDRKRIVLLIAQLDDDQFRVRDKAAKELEALGDAAVPALSIALEKSKSAEMRNQAERILKKIGPGEDPATSAVARRMVRAVEALERAGTPEAVALLKDLANLGKTRLLHEEATSALKRLSPPR